MMVKRRKVSVRKHAKGQTDHVDAWLMSYADMITLLFMLFAIFVSFAMSQKHSASQTSALGEPEHPTLHSNHSGLLSLQTSSDEAYRTLNGLIISSSADQYASVERKDHGVWVDLSVPYFFNEGSAEPSEGELPLLKKMLHSIKEKAPAGASIEVAAFAADDANLTNSNFSTSWELTGMQAAHITSLLIAEGVNPSALSATSHASNEPLVPNKDTQGRPITENELRNQRIIIKIEEPTPPQEPEILHTDVSVN